MLRITQVSEDRDHVCLKLEGRVIGDWVSELARTCGSCLSRSRHITLDLSDVTYIDRRGVEMLKKILGENVRMMGATLLVQALLGRQVVGKIRRGKTIGQGGPPIKARNLTNPRRAQ